MISFIRRPGAGKTSDAAANRTMGRTVLYPFTESDRRIGINQVSRGPKGLFDEIKESERHRVLHAGVRREDAYAVCYRLAESPAALGFVGMIGKPSKPTNPFASRLTIQENVTVNDYTVPGPLPCRIVMPTWVIIDHADFIQIESATIAAPSNRKIHAVRFFHVASHPAHYGCRFYLKIT